jgi:hypothetical protein
VSDPDDVLLGRAELERAFTALGERLVRRGHAMSMTSACSPE